MFASFGLFSREIFSRLLFVLLLGTVFPGRAAGTLGDLCGAVKANSAFTAWSVLVGCGVLSGVDYWFLEKEFSSRIQNFMRRGLQWKAEDTPWAQGVLQRGGSWTTADGRVTFNFCQGLSQGNTPNCAYYSVMHAVCLQNHLLKCKKPGLRDILSAPLFKHPFFVEFIRNHRKKAGIKESEGLNLYHSACVSNIITKSLGLVFPGDYKNTSSVLALPCPGRFKALSALDFYTLSWRKGDRYVERSFLYKLLGGDPNFGKLWRAWFSGYKITRLHKHLYEKICSGKIVIAYWPSENVGGSREDGSGHATCRVFVPTLKNGVLEHLDIVIIDSSGATYRQADDWKNNPARAAEALNDMPQFIEHLFAFRPAVA